ncbi:unnamed protein product [Mesocestoides corti]|uniref:Helicase ATP-binding domain-containing protein n=1 Tax=Mesocestoides corti TaxID=53468 RepID=A0A0R3UC57_MESCO|nr:unnamed protein product [Mesocestoides corti]
MNSVAQIWGPAPSLTAQAATYKANWASFTKCGDASHIEFSDDHWYSQDLSSDEEESAKKNVEKASVNVDAITQQALVEHSRESAERVTAYSVLENSLEQLPPLSELIPDPATNWPFELDTFQKQAIRCLERNQSVLVTAPTSAGKTAVAEYACAMCRRRGSRAIYTSPKKALSNQKFREFRRIFGNDVGLITGDTNVANKSGVLIMTTEILLHMVCSHDDAISDLGVVIMDETHFTNDLRRDQVWEQLLIVLPQHVVLVLLSPILANVVDFADWLGRIRGGTCIHVCHTLKRPVPLEHFIYTGNYTHRGRALHLVMSGNNEVNQRGYEDALAALTTRNTQDESSYTADKVTRKDTSEEGCEGCIGLWSGLLRVLQEHKLLPAIVFSFSHSKIAHLVDCFRTVDLLNEAEKTEVGLVISAAIDSRLKECDRDLEQVGLVRRLVTRGFAFHHAGMLPVLKEVSFVFDQ